MTEALCLNCGAIKFGAICPCEECGASSSGDVEIDITFSDHHISVDQLKRFGSIIRMIQSNCEDKETAAWSFIAYVSENHPEILEADVPSHLISDVNRALRTAGVEHPKDAIGEALAALADDVGDIFGRNPTGAITRKELIALSWEVQDALNQSIVLHDRFSNPPWRSLVPIPGVYKPVDYASLDKGLSNIIESLSVVNNRVSEFRHGRLGRKEQDCLNAISSFIDALRKKNRSAPGHHRRAACETRGAQSVRLQDLQTRSPRISRAREELRVTRQAFE